MLSLTMVFQPLGTSSEVMNTALMSGWSKQGKTERAMSGTKRVNIYSALRLRALSQALKSSSILFSPFSVSPMGMMMCPAL